MVSDSTDTADTKALRLGARLVVELLRVRAVAPASKQISLCPNRSKNAMAVLRDRLLLLQQSLPFPSAVPNVAEALIVRCSDLKIPLPVASPDWGLILLLDQMFDRFVSNQIIDEEAQQWLGSLRLPVIRYALLDYSFFFAPQNLLRRFLNQIYLSLLSSSQKSRAVMRQSVEGFLRQVVHEFRDDIGTCNRICIEAQAWFAGHNDKVGQIEEQIRSQEMSLRKEQVAEPRVVRELNCIVAGKQLPKLVVEFLHGEWRRSLRLVSMREGDEGSTWKRQVRITESLVEFVQECDSEAGRAKHRNFYPVLMKNIKSLLVSVNEDAATLEEALDPLELILTAMINGAQAEMQTVPELEMPQSHVTSVEVRQVSSKAMNQIDALELGSWVRIQTTDGSHELFRIALKAQAEEPWLLVSQSGKTITKKTAFQLAQGLEGNVLHLIGQGHWWDEQLELQMAQLHERWLQLEQQRQQEQARLQAMQEEAARVAADAKAAPSFASHIELVSLEQQATASHTISPTIDSRTDQILQNSQLQLVDDKAGSIAPKTTSTDDDSVDFLAPREITEEEKATALQAIDQIQEGGWITQQTSKGEERCKLAVRIRGRDKMIFVNRLGVKVLEIDRLQLAELVARGLVSIADTGQKFANTLERVVRSIQEDRKPNS